MLARFILSTLVLLAAFHSVALSTCTDNRPTEASELTVTLEYFSRGDTSASLIPGNDCDHCTGTPLETVYLYAATSSCYAWTGASSSSVSGNRFQCDNGIFKFSVFDNCDCSGAPLGQRELSSRCVVDVDTSKCVAIANFDGCLAKPSDGRSPREEVPSELRFSYANISIDSEVFQTSVVEPSAYCVSTSHDSGYIILLICGVCCLVVFLLAIILFAAWNSIFSEDTREETLFEMAYYFLILVIIACLILGVVCTTIGGVQLHWLRTYSPDTCGIEIEHPIAGVPFESLQGAANITVAYIAESGRSSNTIAVLQLIKQEAEMLVHLGNFDKCDEPQTFHMQLDVVLGVDFPIFAEIGNQDIHRWGDYQEVLLQHMQEYTITTGGRRLTCTGAIGSNWYCYYRGILIAGSPIGTLCGDGYSNTAQHEQWMRQIFKEAEEYKEHFLWNVCAFHKTQRLLQVTGLSDETNWEIFNICQRNEAFVVTGAQNYARTHGLGDIETQEVVKTCLRNQTGCYYDLSHSTVVAVSGLGGQTVWAMNDEDPEALHKLPHWASSYDKESGALFCSYNYNGDPSLAYCYFKNISNEIVDEFWLRHPTNLPHYTVKEEVKDESESV